MFNYIVHILSFNLNRKLQIINLVFNLWIILFITSIKIAN
jgi:hypothetical protein